MAFPCFHFLFSQSVSSTWRAECRPFLHLCIHLSVVAASVFHQLTKCKEEQANVFIHRPAIHQPLNFNQQNVCVPFVNILRSSLGGRCNKTQGIHDICITFENMCEIENYTEEWAMLRPILHLNIRKMVLSNSFNMETRIKSKQSHELVYLVPEACKTDLVMFLNPFPLWWPKTLTFPMTMSDTCCTTLLRMKHSLEWFWEGLRLLEV